MSNTEKPTEQNDLSLNTENTSEDYTQARLVPDNGNPEQTDPSSKSENTSDDHAQKTEWTCEDTGIKECPGSRALCVRHLATRESEAEFETLFRELQEEWMAVGR